MICRLAVPPHKRQGWVRGKTTVGVCACPHLHQPRIEVRGGGVQFAAVLGVVVLVCVPSLEGPAVGLPQEGQTLGKLNVATPHRLLTGWQGNLVVARRHLRSQRQPRR